jgi:hypothetical protein
MNGIHAAVGASFTFDIDPAQALTRRIAGTPTEVAPSLRRET